MPWEEAMDKKLQVIQSFLAKQNVLDMRLTLGQLRDQLGGAEELAGYTFAWDKYVYKTADVADQVATNSLKARRSILSDNLLNLKVSMMDLVSLARDTGIDEVAGYIYTEDKFTFIVGKA